MQWLLLKSPYGEEMWVGNTLFLKIKKKVKLIKIHSLARPNYNLLSFLNEEIDSASFGSFESWFQSIAPLNLKLFLETIFSV